MSLMFRGADREQNKVLNTVKGYHIFDEHNWTRFIEWAEKNRVKRQTDCKQSWAKMLKRKYRMIQYVDEELPGCEYQELFERWDDTRILVGHTYHKEEDFDWRNFMRFLDERGLVLIGERHKTSWFNPGVTYSFIIEIENEAKYVAYMDNNMYAEVGSEYYRIG